MLPRLAIHRTVHAHGRPRPRPDLLLATGDIHGALVTPPVDSALAWLQDFYQQELPLFRQSLPPAWHERFATWLAAQGRP